MVDEDRRRWRRLRADLRLELGIAEQGEPARRLGAVGSHLSPEGIFVQVADPPPIGTQVVVRVETEGADGVLTAEGEVVRREVLDQSSDVRPGVGIRLSPSPGWRVLYAWLAGEADD